MEELNYEVALQKISEIERKPPEQIKAMIQSAIDKVFASEDKRARDMWTSITENGEKPTVEQVLTEFAVQMSKLKNFY